MTKKIFYIANIRIPTERAHGIQIMNMCNAFSKKGFDLTLIVPTRKNKIKDDPFEYYGLEVNFKIKKIRIFDTVQFGKYGFAFERALFSVFSVFYTLTKKVDIVYGRDELPLWLLSLFKETVWESHMPRDNFISNLFIKTQKKIVVITEGLKKFYISKGVDEKRILVASDAVDLGKFDISFSKEECREKLGLDKNRKIALYTGHLYKWKGVDTFAQSREYLGSDIDIMLVGGLDHEISRLKKLYPNITVFGRVLHQDVPFYLKAADVLVLPNSATSEISQKYTSPMKLFEYMVSGVPIVASDLESIREVLHKKNSILVPADSPQELAGGIKLALDVGTSMAIKAREDVEKYTWGRRVERIARFFNNN